MDSLTNSYEQMKTNYKIQKTFQLKNNFHEINVRKSHAFQKDSQELNNYFADVFEHFKEIQHVTKIDRQNCNPKSSAIFQKSK